MRNAHMSKEDLEKHQKKTLRAVMLNAYNNTPYFNKIFKEHKLSPDDIKTTQDLNKLPIITKQDIREHHLEMISTEAKHILEKETSGSTGTPMPVYISQNEDDYRKAKHLRSSMLVGHKPWDKYVVLTSPHHFNQVPALIRRLRFFSRDFVSVFDEREEQLNKLKNFQPDIISGYSSSIYLVAKEIQERNLEIANPKFILGGAELSDIVTRKYIEEAFQCPFYDQYATVEVERMSWQCKEKNEYHIDADSMILQFVDESGEEVSPGERGEIICTSLFSYAMPFIRYNVGDIGVSSDDECSCDITFPTMKIIEGRTDSMITMPGGRVLSPRNFAITVNHFEHILQVEQWRLVQEKIDHFEIYFMMGDKTLDPTLVENKMETYMHETLNTSPEQVIFNVNVVEEIPQEKTGKLRAIVSLLENS
jgi:phenylacetate-CoA ligase